MNKYIRQCDSITASCKYWTDDVSRNIRWYSGKYTFIWNI